MKLPPLVLANGTKIDPSTGEVIDTSAEALDEDAAVELEEAGERDQQITITTKRFLHELPATPQEMNAISAVLTLQLLGVSNADIAYQLGVAIEAVETLMQSEAFLDVRRDVITSLIRSMEDDVRGVFAKHALPAAKKIVSHMRLKDPEAQYRASKDILDRAGFSPQQTINHKHSMEDELVIRVVKDAPPAITTIDMKIDKDA